MKVKNCISPHIWWIIGIMTIIIISLLSYILCCRIDNAEIIMEFISYSTAILSITLSIFAIQYTYFSNVQTQQQFEKINSSAEVIQTTASKLNETGLKLDNNLDVILQQLKVINESQQQMSTQITNLNSNTTIDSSSITSNFMKSDTSVK